MKCYPLTFMGAFEPDTLIYQAKISAGPVHINIASQFDLITPNKRLMD
jgi:hypothetical protein